MQLWLLTADLFALAFTLVFFSLFYPAVPLVPETIVSEWDSTDVLGKTPFLSRKNNASAQDRRATVKMYFN